MVWKKSLWARKRPLPCGEHPATAPPPAKSVSIPPELYLAKSLLSQQTSGASDLRLLLLSSLENPRGKEITDGFATCLE